MKISPWLEHYDAGVPHTLRPYPDRTLLNVVSDTAIQRPDHPALFFKGTRLSYRELELLSNAFAHALVAQGVRKGDRVALLLPNSPQAVLAQFGAWKAGAIVAPLNPLYTERELEYALKECGAETIVTLTLFYRKVKSLQPRTLLRRVIATNIKEYLPPLLRLLFIVFKEGKEGHRITLDASDLWWAALLSHHAAAARPKVPVGPGDPALLLFTGGTTGTPKAAVGTHQALLVSAMQTHAWFRSAIAEWDDTVVLAMPLFHVYGNVGILATSLIGHNPLVVVPNPRDLNDLLTTVRQVRPAFLPGVPSLFTALLNQPRVRAGRGDLTSIKLCISGAAPLLAETKIRFEALTSGRIVDAYSLSEAINAAVINPVRGPAKVGAVGMPLPDVEIRIVDSDTARTDMPAGEIGEILMRAPQLMSGYWGRPEETAEMIRDGWLHTGDMGYLDEDGYLFIVDRKKDMIKPGGFQVWPREVEEVIASHPAVAEVGVAGVRDDKGSEAVKAWVVLQAGVEISQDALRTYCRERLAAYKVPKYIEFRDSLPKTQVGKVLRRELVAEKAPASGSTRMPKINVNGAALYYEEHGRGPEAIVFAHGLLWSSRIFRDQVNALQHRYRCITFDFRGHGQSEVTRDGYDMDTLAEDVAQLIEKLDCAPCNFVGHSMGGFIGLRLAIRRPALIKSLVLLESSADPQPAETIAQYRLLNFIARWFGIGPAVGQVMPLMFGKKFLSDPERGTLREEWRQCLVANDRIGITNAVKGVISRMGVYDQTHQITVPTLVIVGDQDVAAPPAMAERLSEAISGSQLVLIPGAGHTPTVEEPGAVTGALEAFLKDL